ncbi:MAG: hypothetical protein AAF532_10920 [Planctomycetota bacterium]
MEPSDFLRVAVGKLEAIGVDYFVTGSVASSYYGEPRFTNDLDVVAVVERKHVRAFADAFPPDEYYCSSAMIDEAIRLRRQFNIIHPDSGFKIDVMVSDGSEFDRSRFDRRRRLDIGQSEAWFASPEDVCLKKLAYYREGGSEKHTRDVAGMIRLLGPAFDRVYSGEWARRLDLTELWDKVVALADTPPAGPNP